MLTPERLPRRTGTFFVFNLDWPLPVHSAPRIPAHFAQAGPEAARPLAAAMGLDDPAPVLQRFASSRRCCVARVEGQLVAYGWMSFKEEYIGEQRLRIQLQPGEAYVWDCATLPSQRRLGLYTALLIHILQTLRDEGLCRVWIGADLDNIPSHQGMIRAGFLPVADLAESRVGNLHSLHVLGRPGVPESLVEDARRVMLGDAERQSNFR